MTRIPLNDNSSSDSFGEKIGTGVYIKIGEVKSVVDHSNYPKAEGEKKTIGNKGFEPELCLEIEFAVDDYKKKVMLFGNFKRNSNGLVTGWDGWNNNVQRLLYKLLGNQAELEEDLSIPNDVLQKLIGKQFKFISYQSNREYESQDGTKYAYQTFPKIFTVSDTKDEINNEWINQLPYVRDYAPEIAEERAKQSTSFKPDDFKPEIPENFNEDVI